MDKIDLGKYQALIFDCDGVILNSNRAKTEAFYNIAKVYGHEAAQALKDYHVKNGGISRYKKFEYFISDILQKPIDRVMLDDLLSNFAYEVKKALLSCEVVAGLELLKAKTPHAKWIIVSGGDETELREVFVARGLNKLFEGGIFGSPDNKDDILARELEKQNIIKPSLFIGDSKYDYRAARQAGLDFLFLTQWTEVKDWRMFCREHGLKYCFDLKALQ